MSSGSSTQLRATVANVILTASRIRPMPSRADVVTLLAASGSAPTARVAR